MNTEDIQFIDNNGEFVDFHNKTWDVIKSYFDQKNVWVAHQIDSYNDCMTNMIPDIIHDKMTNPCVINGGINTESGTFDLEYMLTFKDVYIGKPVIQENNGATKLLTPAEARTRNITYSASLYADVEHQIKYRKDNGEWDEPDKEFIPHVMIGKIIIIDFLKVILSFLMKYIIIILCLLFTCFFTFKKNIKHSKFILKVSMNILI